jgi:hypothetical protein
MSLPPEIPERLLRSLRAAGQDAAVPADQVEPALEYLRRLLLDFDALERHIAFLQELYDSPFCYARPRRDYWSPERAEPDLQGSRFPYAKPLPDPLVHAILDEGPDRLRPGKSPPDELGKLLLNPVALYDLFDLITDILPDAWIPELQRLGQARRQQQLAAGPSKEPATIPLPAKPPKNQGAEGPGGPRAVARADGARAWRLAALSSLAAAAVLVVCLIVVLRRQSGGGGDAGANLVVSATPKFGDRKGTTRPLTGMVVTSNFDGFVTLVFFEPKNRQVVLPTPGSTQEWRVAGDGSPTAVVLPDHVEDATAALVIVTETPADAPIRKLLDPQRYTADQIDQAQSLLQTRLRDLNFKRFTIKPIKLDTR